MHLKSVKPSSSILKIYLSKKASKGGKWDWGEIRVRIRGSVRSLSMATHSSTLAWKIPWPEEPLRLQSLGSLRVGHDWAASLSLFTFVHWRRKWQPTPVFLPGGSQGRGAWWAAISGVAQSQTQLKQLSSSNEVCGSPGAALDKTGFGRSIPR